MRRRLFPILLTLLLVCIKVDAQTPVVFGPAIYYEYGLPLSITRSPGIVNHFPTDGAGTSFNHTVVVGANMLARDLIGKTFGISAHAALGLSSGNFTSDPFFIDTLIQPPQQRIFSVSSTAAMFTSELRLRLQPSEQLGIEAGVWMSARFLSTLIQQLRTTQGATVDSVVATGDRISTPPIHLGGSFAISLLSRVSNTLMILPEAFLRADIGALGDGLGTHALSGGLGLSFFIGRNSAIDTEQVVRLDTPRVIPPRIDSSKKTLTASIDIYSQNPNGTRSDSARVALSSVTKRRIVPFVPAIFFDRNSSAINAHYMAEGKLEAAMFSDTSLSEREPEDLCKLVLDVLGARLRRLTQASVSLRGSISNGESTELASKRAEIVRNYLVQSYGIDPRRITIESHVQRATKSESDFARSVRISSSSSALFAPIVAEWVEESYRLPPIRLNRRIVADAGIRNASVEITHGGVRVASSSLEQGEWKSFDLNLPVGTRAPLAAHLVVQDSAGQTIEARDEMQLIVDNSSADASNSSDVLAQFPVENKDVPGIAASNKAAASLLATYIPPGSQLTLTRPSDRNSSGARLADSILDDLKRRRIAMRAIHIVPTKNGSTMRSLEQQLFAAGLRAEVTVER